jgi:hypothetical protein
MPLVEGLDGRVQELEPEGTLKLKPPKVLLPPVLPSPVLLPLPPAAAGEAAAAAAVGEGVGKLCKFALVTMTPVHEPPKGVGVVVLGLLTKPHVDDAAHQPHAAFEMHVAWLGEKLPLLVRLQVSRTATPTLVPLQDCVELLAFHVTQASSRLEETPWKLYARRMYPVPVVSPVWK